MFKNIFKIILLNFLVLGFLGCREDANILYQTFPEKMETKEVQVFKVKDLLSSRKVDILWVVDNSGSMGPYQKSLIENTEIFLNEFLNFGGVDWRMGLISTDVSKAPYAGLTPTDRIEYTDPDAAKKFKAAVGRLGTSGAPDEMTFDPVVKHLEAFPDFLRPNALFSLIMVTDANDQSKRTSYPLFSQFIKNLVPKYQEKFRPYGVYASNDLPCRTNQEYWEYTGSTYEQLITDFNGISYGLCDDFGKSLSSLATNISQQVGYSRAPLRFRPIPLTITITFNGVEIPGGAKEKGGFWVYLYDTNEIVFHDLEFAPGDEEKIVITFEKEI